MSTNPATGPVTYRIRDLEHPGEHVDISVSGGRAAALNRMYMAAWVKEWKRPRLSILNDDASETEVPQ